MYVCMYVCILTSFKCRYYRQFLDSWNNSVCIYMYLYVQYTVPWKRSTRLMYMYSIMHVFVLFPSDIFFPLRLFPPEDRRRYPVRYRLGWTAGVLSPSRLLPAAIWKGNTSVSKLTPQYTHIYTFLG